MMKIFLLYFVCVCVHANIIQNPSFEELGKDGIPVNWNSYIYTPSIFCSSMTCPQVLNYNFTAKDGVIFAYLRPFSLNQSTYCIQTTPHHSEGGRKRYLISFWMYIYAKENIKTVANESLRINIDEETVVSINRENWKNFPDSVGRYGRVSYTTELTDAFTLNICYEWMAGENIEFLLDLFSMELLEDEPSDGSSILDIPDTSLHFIETILIIAMCAFIATCFFVYTVYRIRIVTMKRGEYEKVKLLKMGKGDEYL